MNTSEEQKKGRNKCHCVYCDEELDISKFPFCQPCGVTLRYCVKCETAVVRDAEVCPHCGGELDWR